MRKTAIRIIAIILAAVCSAVPFTGVSASMTIKDIAEEQVVDLTAYINALVLPNGAFPMNEPSVSNFSTQGLETIDGVTPEVYTRWPAGKIVPYFSELAILGALKTSPDGAKEAAERFIDWYFAHLNDKTTDLNGVDGTVYDYYCFVDPADSEHIIEVTVRKLNEHKYTDNPSENPNDYDSTDSYAACFLRVLYEYYKNYGGDLLKDKKDDVLRIVGALKSTYVPALGLTGAKPNYMVCYLMDNCEVYDGLVAGAKLFDELYGDQAAAKELQELSGTVKNAIETHLWSDELGAYYPYVFADGKAPGKIDLDVFYPDATAQLFAISYGLIEPESERAQKLYADFNSHFGTRLQGWHVLKTGDAFPWASISGVAAKMQDYERLEIYIQVIKSRFQPSGYGYPFYNSEAGAMLNMYDIFLNSEYYKETYLSADAVSSPESETESSTAESTVSAAESTDEANGQKGGIGKYLLIGGLAALAIAGVLVFAIRKKAKKHHPAQK